MPKVRVDVLLVGRGLAESRAQAQRLVMAGMVRLDGQVVLKPGVSIQEDARLEVDQGPPFVSRGGEKLQAALATFALDVSGRVCADVGASTGGFTDCLLQHGARRVYAIDVGQGILHWKLRQDLRVVVMERTNARHVERLPEPVSLVTIDASFISLKILLPVVKGWGMGGRGEVIALIKPQFEAGRAAVARGEGVIRDPAIHRQVLQDMLAFAQLTGYGVRGLIRSPLLGPKGNAEFLAWLIWPGMPGADVEAMIVAALPY
jgi:23S rRNA (cytidine1920-2'-O)/16S rRNA (cytidine1409-2'-O)-methyltransferase